MSFSWLLASCVTKIGANLASSSSLPTEQRAIANCRSIIRACQLDDGAFRVKSEGDPVWIQPYFANQAALALLAAKNHDDLPFVSRWIVWYARHQNPLDGTIDDFEGTVSGGYNDNGKRDSVDSYAATYLMVVDRYHRTTKGSMPANVVAAVHRAYEAVCSVTDPTDGLTWSKLDYKVKFLQDNVEVYGGLVAARSLFRSFRDQGSTPLAIDALRRSKRLRQGLLRYWRPDAKRFAYALQGDDTFTVRPDEAAAWRRTEGMANLCGLTWIAPSHGPIWETLKKQYKPDGYISSADPNAGNAPDAPPERWYIASTLVASRSEASKRRYEVVEQACLFSRDNVYLHRPAITLLALKNGASWLPCLDLSLRAIK